MNGKEVRVLRDTGCRGVVVRRSLVSDGQMLNKQSGMTLINNYKQRCPVARINIDCPFFRGTTDVLCIDDPAHDLVIGNIEGSKFPDMTHFSSGVVNEKKSRKDRKVKVADKFIRQNRQELCLKQVSDVKLREIRRKAESGSETQGRRRRSGRMVSAAPLLWTSMLSALSFFSRFGSFFFVLTSDFQFIDAIINKARCACHPLTDLAKV